MTEHLGREQLLGYLDGELPKPAMLRAAEHIQSCWTCRTELERLKEDIGTILDAQNRIILPGVPPPPQPWPRLEPRIAAQLTAKESLFSQLWRRATTAYELLPRPLCLGAAVAGLLVIAAILSLSPSTLSANEVLRKLSDAEARRMPSTIGVFVRQKVRVRKTARRDGLTRSGEVDSWRSANAVHWKIDEADPVALDLQDRYRARKTLNDLPISAASCGNWSAGGALDGKVIRSSSAMEIVFTTPNQSIEADFLGLALQVNPDDWHVTEMRLEFADAAFDISEEELNVFSRKDVPADVLASFDAPVQATIGAKLSAKIAPPVVPDISAQLDLDEVEMNVRFALHQIGADLGEPLEIRRDAGLVAVRAWQVSPERQELLKDLLDKPGVHLELVPPGDASSVNQLPPASLSPPASADPGFSPELRRLDEERLMKWFGSTTAKEVFTRSALAAMTDLLSRLFAMKQLADRWPADTKARLSSSANSHLTTMVKDDFRSAANRSAELKAMVGPLVKAFVPDANVTPSAEAPTAWQNASTVGLETAKEADRLLRSLITTTSAPLSLDRGLPLLNQKLSDLDSQLHPN